jgi:hypothetical protein
MDIVHTRGDTITSPHIQASLLWTLSVQPLRYNPDRTSLGRHFYLNLMSKKISKMPINGHKYYLNLAL